MKITKTVLACLAVLAFFALTTRSARAGDTDCNISLNTCNFGTLTGDVAGGVLVGTTDSSERATFAEQVYVSGGVYTYVFTITNTSTDGTNLDLANTYTLPFPSHDYFNSHDAWGVVTDQTSTGVDDIAFNFLTGSLSVNYSSLAPGQSFTFYAQGAGPTNGQFYGGNSGPTGADSSWDPKLVSEPNVLTLLGSLLLVLVLGMPFTAVLRRRTA